jgi:DNA-binding CsgD family transcriptional regulator
MNMTTTTLTDSDVAALLRIAGEAGELGRNETVRRRHVLERLLSLVGGCWAVCSEMDPSPVNESGWAVPNSITCAGELSSYQQDVIDRYLTGKLAALDPCIPPLLRTNKPVATVRREDVVDDSWFRSDHFDRVRRPLGFGESMYGILTTPDGRRLKLSMHRELNDPSFTQRDVRLVQMFNENLAGLYIAPACACACACACAGGAAGPGAARQHHAALATLPARVRPVLQRLLAGDGEKQAAQKLGLSRHTVHEYTKVLYRMFGVNSRSELLARFVVSG